jgi:histone acetyltransferase 1
MARDVDDDGYEPPAKRVRFRGGGGEDGEGHSTPDSLSPAPSAPATPSTSLDASKVIELRFVRRPSDIHAEGARGGHDADLTAHPTFTHQIYPGGVVHGAASATAALYYTCGSLTSWLDVAVVPRDDVGEADGDAVTDVFGTLWKLVHAGGVESREQFEAAAAGDAAYTPPFTGEPVMKYARGGRTYSIFKHQLASSPEVVDFHKRMQLLMFMHIDGANFIDSADPRWELFAVFEHVNGAPRYLVGYATVYPFSAIRPGCSLDEGFAERIRVSQVFVLPHVQRGGHGGSLLSAVYRDALQRRAIEVTVEDPSDGFRLLRDATDLPRVYAAGILGADAKMASTADGAAAVARMRNELLITKTQARRCLEIHELRFVDREDEAAHKAYRLWVKRRLHDEFVEVLDAYSGDERKAKLGEIYDDYEAEYMACVRRLAKG